MAVTSEARLLESVPRGLLIGGEWIDTDSSLPVEDPSTGERLTEVADASETEARAALDAAVAAQSAWAQHPPRERGEILRRAYAEIIARRDELALLMTLEMGKPLAESEAEVTYAAEFFRWFSEEAVRIEGRYGLAPNGASRLLVCKQPVGPCLLITPWNFPLAMGTRKIGPAVAAGCTMVVKPAKQTPLSMLALAQIMEHAGLPAGVLNVITSSSASRVMGPLIADPRARKLSFTGSTAVGRTLVEQSAQQLLRVSMELGGNAPFIVFADADLDEAVRGAMLAKMRNGGQACTAANRFLVQEAVAAEFGKRLAAAMADLRVGAGTDESTQLGPMINARAVAGIADKVERSIAAGAQAVLGGQRPDGPGFFYPATVLTEVPRDAPVATDEVFGPVAPIITVADEDDALAIANSSEMGLTGYVYTGDLARGLRVSERLEVGMIGLNRGLVSDPAAPFGGVKQSGLGREGGYEGIDSYLETTYVATNW
jgi:succinate-semialdehyde dehydrogenase / glutarate-semialdehyde dehydrogenase